MGTREGRNTPCLEYMEIKAKSSLARDFAHDRGFAGARGQVEAKARGQLLEK